MKKISLRLRTFYPIFGIIFCFDFKIIYSKVCFFPAYVNLDKFTSFFLRRWQSDCIMSLRKQRPLLASLWMIGALVSISGMAIAGRELSSELNAFQISFTRSLFCLIALIIILSFIGFNKVKTAKPKLHLLRNTIHFGGQTGWLYGVAFLPLAEVFAIEFTAPIWTAILAVIFLKEPLTRYRTLGILLGFCGHYDYSTARDTDNTASGIGCAFCNFLFCLDICLHASYGRNGVTPYHHFLYEPCSTPDRPPRFFTKLELSYLRILAMDFTNWLNWSWFTFLLCACISTCRCSSGIPS